MNKNNRIQEQLVEAKRIQQFYEQRAKESPSNSVAAVTAASMRLHVKQVQAEAKRKHPKKI